MYKIYNVLAIVAIAAMGSAPAFAQTNGGMTGKQTTKPAADGAMSDGSMSTSSTKADMAKKPATKKSMTKKRMMHKRTMSSSEMTPKTN